MFRLFKKKTKKEKLENLFKKLMQEWHDLSTVNRAASDQKFAEAQKIAEQINAMKNEAA
ncbi:Lacal_2735 family protein [Jejuia spongiicola]|uniref:Lacal_2735 family protein n=1 Tax=Jejuia spongiicola TaxID=2942207 RepID=A0ABT0QI25_9FLAO|nr:MULTISPECIES: Lacal_2735 family protein [Flavobacteriaceae]MCL6296108.1 Lacal_2735 family protein [Jejuia spongiicola]